MTDIDPQELAALTHLDLSALSGRAVPLFAVWDGERFTKWHQADERLIKLLPLSLVEGDYFAAAQADPLDLRFEFLETMWKRVSWPEVGPTLHAMESDVHNLAALIAKLDHFWAHRPTIGVMQVSRFVKNEIEHLLTVCRSLFDLLQDLLVRLWAHLLLRDEHGDYKKPKKGLPSSFREMVMSNNVLLASGEIAAKRDIPMPLADVYANWGPFLESLRGVRDDIVHRGTDAPVVFADQRCFAIDRHDRLVIVIANRPASWNTNENLVSLRPVLAHWLFGTLAACDQIVQVFARIFALPNDIAPRHFLFTRTAFGHEWQALRAVANGGSPFWADGS